jgi:prepilin-type N-terminal cleavage/methylation domain-containing protein
VSTRDRKGFTLIELLVVIAIIAVLAAILFPVLLHAKKRAQFSTCSHNTQQWLTAMRMYMNDWNDYFPYCLGTKNHWANLDAPNNPHDSNTPQFYELMWKYTSKNEGIKWCQASVIAYGTGGGWSYWFQCKWTWDGFSRVNEKANLCGIHISKVLYPSKSPAVGDQNRCHETNDGWGNSPLGRERYLFPIGYVDGHVRDIVMVKADENKYWYFGVDGSMPRR